MVVAAALSYGIGPVAQLGQTVADWVLHGFVPWLIVIVATLYISLLRMTLRCPVRVYVGTDPKIRAVVTRCPSFQKDYRPPAWAAGAWAQAVIYLYRSWRNQHLRGLITEQVELPDGEVVNLLWMLPPCCRTEATDSAVDDGNLSDADAPPVPSSVPIIIICHGVFQTSADLYEFCSFLTNQCGYLACVFSRRGNDAPLSRPKFNTVGDQADFRFILSRIRNRFPTHRMYGVGISAGSSLLARYLGDAGEEAEIDGGVLVSPGYDMEKSLRHMTPLADMVITLHAKSFFLTRNKDTLASENKNGLKQLYRSRSMHEFHQHMHVFDGKASSEEYFDAHNPSRVLDKIRKPSVYINAYDDMCFPGDFTFQFKNLVDRCHHATVLHMEKGGHGTFYEGWDAGTSRFFQVVREFVDCLQQDKAFLVADEKVAAAAAALLEQQTARAEEEVVVEEGEEKEAMGAAGALVTTTMTTTITTTVATEEEADHQHHQVVATVMEQREQEVMTVSSGLTASSSHTKLTTFKAMVTTTSMESFEVLMGQ